MRPEDEQVEVPTQFSSMPSELSTAYPPLNLTMDTDLTKWQLDYTDIITQIQHNLRGEIYDSEKDRWVETGIRYMNEQGIGAISLILTQYINKNTFLSNLDNDIILEIVRNVNYDIKNTILVNQEKFEIKGEDRSIITNAIVTAIYESLRRAYQEGEKRFLKLIQQREIVRTTAPIDQQQKQGWWIFGRR